jgi:UPF0716 protein FxsA
MIFSTLLAAFVIMPLLELTVLFEVHDYLGTWPTIGLIIATGFAGAILAKLQGTMVLRRIRQDLAEGRMPAPRLIDGVMILVAGVLLITPGLITDTIGFLLLVPPVRLAIRAWLRRKIEQKLKEGTTETTIWRW